MALDAVPATINLSAVKHYLSALPYVQEVHDLHIWHLSTHEIALTAHLVTPYYRLSDQEQHTIAHTLKQQFNIHHSTIQIEQDYACDFSC
jgi:cobalt-zinc-cadmium efflux system protein